MQRKLRVSNSFPVKHILVMFLILFLSFSINFFGVGSDDWYVGFQKDSDSLVLNKLVCSKDSNSWLIGQGIIAQNSYDIDCTQPMTTYYSQIGLQGRIMQSMYVLVSFFSIDIQNFILFIKVIVPLMSALVMLSFCYWVFKRFGTADAYIVALLIANSVWIVGFSKSLYWAMPLLFLPFIVSLYLFRKKASLKLDTVFFITLFILFSAKFASGYEYTSVILISVVSAIVTIGVLDNINVKRMAYFVSASFIVGILAFMFTVGVHTALIKNNVGSFDKAVSIVKQRVLERTSQGQDFKKYVYGGLGATTPFAAEIMAQYLPLEIYKDTTPLVQTEFVSMANYALLPTISYPIALKEPLQTYVSSFFFSVIIFISLSINTIKNIRKRGSVISKKLNNERALFMGAIIGLLGVLSWLVLARGHSYVHAHINGIIFYLPYGLLLYTLLAIKLVKYSKKIKMVYVKK